MQRPSDRPAAKRGSSRRAVRCGARGKHPEDAGSPGPRTAASRGAAAPQPPRGGRAGPGWGWQSALGAAQRSRRLRPARPGAEPGPHRRREGVERTAELCRAGRRAAAARSVRLGGGRRE